MEIVNFGTFTHYGLNGVMYFTNESGQDWYQMLNGLTSWDERGNFINSIYGAWATVDPETMKIKNVEYDPSKLVPRERIVLGIDADWEDIKEGMLYQNGQIVEAPPEPIKMWPISKRQLKLTLVRNGISLSSIDQVIAAMPESLAREEAQIEWLETQEFERNHPTLLLVANSLGLTKEQVDDLWVQAMET